jgi:PAS domain S-box-containing protein
MTSTLTFPVRLSQLLDMSVVQRLAEANYKATGMPIGVIDAFDGSVLVGCGWQDICTQFHRADPRSLERCRESDDYIKSHLMLNEACEYTCKNGLRDIGVPIVVAGEHLATLFLGQFFYEDESPDREFFIRQAAQYGYDLRAYLSALERVPTFDRRSVENIVAYDRALVRFISDLAEGALRHARDEQALGESEERFRMLADNMAQLAWIADEQGHIRWFNKRWYDYTGLLPTEPDGTEARLVHPEHRERVVAKIQHCFKAGEAWEDTFPIRGKDGSYRWFLSRSHPIRDAAGKVIRWFGTNTDVTEQRQAEEVLREVDRRKDEFLSVLSHELRNPLAPIRNSIHLLEHTDAASEQALRARAVIRRQTEHLTRLVDDLLDMTRIAKGKIELCRERLDVAGVVRQAGEDLRSVIAGRGLELTLDLPAEPVIVDGDATRLSQVLGNLLQNAAKFTPSGGSVAVSVRAGADSAEIRVRDTGVGIAPGVLDRVFEPFFQGEGSLARTEGGLGLGLALVKTIAELHGGSARAESAGRDEGTELIVRLPLAAGTATRTAPDGATRRAAAHGRRVLVVDDNVDAADSLAELVQLFGHATEVAYDGPTALAKATANPPDVVLCDIGLPGMSGYDVARALRARRTNGMRLIAVSGYAQPEDLERASEAGFDHHVAKPPDPDLIERLLG